MTRSAAPPARTAIAGLLALCLLLAACSARDAPAPTGPGTPGAADSNGNTAASEATIAANTRFGEGLVLDEQQDVEEASRGLIASEPDALIQSTLSGARWSAKDFDFIEGEAPDSVNPSLWRQAKLNTLHGLFEVTEGIYQVRGYDLANMSWIRGKTGWIVVDPLTSRESAEAAVRLARKHLGDAPVVAVIFTHSHIDHFWGIDCLVPPERRGGLRIVAPAGFVEEAASENVLAGIAMGRRASYQFGHGLPLGERSYVDSGLGKRGMAGEFGIALPTDIVDRTPQALSLDGVEFIFQYVPDSEAPAELAFYLPGSRSYCGAEIVNRTMHNLYTLRGAKVRDALRWSGYIDEAIQRFGDMERVFTSHHWPVFGAERAIAFLKGQRDTYRFIHDQTLRLANQGATPREIAEQLELPPQLAANFANRGYYGTLRHNAKAVYQFYFGWYDGNPANLDPLPPVELGQRYVEAMGGAAALREKARAAIAAADYRWAVTLLDHAVFADPADSESRELLASAYDQLGYQAESGVWRSAYLSAAQELRHGIPALSSTIRSAQGLLAHVPLELFFSAMATRLNGPRAAEADPVSINFVFTDIGETHVLTLENAVLHHRQREADPAAATTLRLTRPMFQKLLTGEAGVREVLLSQEIGVEGSRTALIGLLSLLDPADGRFPIVTP